MQLSAILHCAICPNILMTFFYFILHAKNKRKFITKTHTVSSSFTKTKVRLQLIKINVEILYSSSWHILVSCEIKKKVKWKEKQSVPFSRDRRGIHWAASIKKCFNPCLYTQIYRIFFCFFVEILAFQEKNKNFFCKFEYSDTGWSISW